MEIQLDKTYAWREIFKPCEVNSAHIKNVIMLLLLIPTLHIEMQLKYFVIVSGAESDICTYSFIQPKAIDNDELVNHRIILSVSKQASSHAVEKIVYQ